MKKFIYIFLIAIVCLFSLCGCNSQVDYFTYVSQLRFNIYFYEEDNFSFKIYVSERESPYCSDGIKGEMSDLIEVFLNMTSTPKEVEIAVGEYSGEMNYVAVSKSFYLSFSGKDFNAESVNVTTMIDGKEKQFDAVSVLYDGMIDGKTALECVKEYDNELLTNLTNGKYFNGEIYIRLLFDNDCFYYVGICDKQGNISAYLVDANNGHIIAQRTQ